MKPRSLYIALFILILGNWHSFAQTDLQFVPYGPNLLGGTIVDVHIDRTNGQNVFAVSEAGYLWRSEDYGFNWLPWFEALSGVDGQFNVKEVGQDKSGQVYAATSRGLYVLENNEPKLLKGDTSWFYGNRAISQIEPDPNNDKKIYALGGGRLYHGNLDDNMSGILDPLLCVQPGLNIRGFKLTSDGTRILAFDGSNVWYSDNPTQNCSFTKVQLPLGATSGEFGVSPETPI